MFIIVYHTEPEEKAGELEWLKEQKIFPSCEDSYDWIKNKVMIRFGVIVSAEQALVIKLRHRLDLQSTYKQR